MSMTKNQKKLLAYVEEHRLKTGMGPSYREISSKIKLSSIRSVHLIVRALAKKGFLTNASETKFRSLQLTDRGREALKGITLREEFPTYVTSKPNTIVLTGASMTSNHPDIAYMNSRLMNNGTSTHGNSNLKSMGSTKENKLAAEGTKVGRSLISVQNSTINLPLSSIRVPAISLKDDILLAPISFILIKIFDGSFLWFCLLLISMWLLRNWVNIKRERR